MVCLWCGKKLGFFRRLLDREFCSQSHKKLASEQPNRILKEVDATSDYDLQELWTTEKDKRKGAKSNPVGPLLVSFSVTMMVVLALTGQGNGGGAQGQVGGSPLASLDPGTSGSWGGRMKSMLRSHAPVTLTHDFSNGLGDFISAANSAVGRGRGDNSIEPSGLRPGRLRLWERSTSLSDYEMEFVAQIDQRSINWAFRAPDVANYYATKLVIGRSNTGPNAGIVRWATLAGKEQDRVQLPLPISLERGVPYRVRMSVQGSRFVTAVNGQVVSTWSDQRLRRGGVGFFAEEGEIATVKWVSVSERDSTLSRILSHFSYAVLPAPWMLAGYQPEE
jgi:hypothetical protein